MAPRLDTVSMILELEAAGIELDLEIERTYDERQNYIIHQYDITFLQVGWQFQAETAELVYKSRNYRGQTWTKAWRSQ